MSNRNNSQQDVPQDWVPVEGVDYVIEHEEPVGPPCPVCRSRQYTDYKGRLFCASCEADAFSRYAKQDSNLNLRISANLIEDLKQMAKHQGVRSYQALVRDILIDAVRRSQKKTG